MWQISGACVPKKKKKKSHTKLIEYSVLLWRRESFFMSLLLYEAEPGPFCGTCYM